MPLNYAYYINVFSFKLEGKHQKWHLNCLVIAIPAKYGQKESYCLDYIRERYFESYVNRNYKVLS